MGRGRSFELGGLTEEEREAVGGKFLSYGRKGDMSYRHWMRDVVDGDAPPNGTSLVERRRYGGSP